MAPRDSYIWMLGPQSVEQFGKDQEGTALWEEVCHWEQAQSFQKACANLFLFLCPLLVDGDVNS